MIGPTSDPILTWMREYTERTGHAPSADEIYEAANFRAPGGIARLLAALRQVGLQHIQQRR